MTRPSWDEYFLGVVDSLARRATCDRGRSAALFVRDNDILAAGYVGAPPGQPDCDQVGHKLEMTLTATTDARRLESIHCVRTIHAETNAILRAARIGVSLVGATIYCTMTPCYRCAMNLVSMDVERVVPKARYHAGLDSEELFNRARIRYEPVNLEIVSYG